MSHDAAPPLSEDQARDAINRWSAAGVFRLRNMGDKIFVEQITAGAAYTVRLQTHCEQRHVQKTQQPYHGGPVDDRGRPPDRWDLQVSRPGEFEERTEAVPVPHTERVQMCDGCAGAGRVSCPTCLGQGRMTCPRCAGVGFVEQQHVEPGQTNADGTPVVRTIRRGCSCSGGLVVCSGCGGQTVVRCGTCAGSGQVKTFDQLVVRFLTGKQGEVIDVTPVPDKWLGGLPGEVLVDRKEPRIDGCEVSPANVAQKAEELLARSHAVDAGKERILMQLLRVERIPLQEVRYKYAGVERQLWICGTKEDIYAPNAPWNRQRLFALIGGVTLAVAVAVGLVAFLIARW